MISWEIVTILTGFVHTAGQFYAARFFLGVAESRRRWPISRGHAGSACASAAVRSLAYTQLILPPL